MRRLAARAVLLAAVAAAMSPPALAPARDGGLQVGHSTLVVPCGPQGTRLAADWYFPQMRKATGLVWVQHGFFRAKRNVATLARYLAEHTGAVVVAPTIPSNFLDRQGCWINGAPMERAVAALFSGPRTALRESAEAAFGGRVRLPRRFVLTGHSAGGNLATTAAGFTTLDGGAIGDLRGVVMYDGVDAAGSMARALALLSGRDDRPVLQIAAPPSSCNAGGAGTRALVSARPNRFVGVLLEGGTHVDAEGPDGDLLARFVCGRPLAVNVEALRSIAADWVHSLLTGSSDGITGGAPGERIAVDGATAVVLPAN